MKKTRMKAPFLGCICAVTTALSAVLTSAATVVAGGSSSTKRSGLCTAAPGTYNEQQSGEISVDKPSAPPTVWVVGDSTAAAFSDTTYYSPRYGGVPTFGLYLRLTSEILPSPAPVPNPTPTLTSTRLCFRVCRSVTMC